MKRLKNISFFLCFLSLILLTVGFFLQTILLTIQYFNTLSKAEVLAIQQDLALNYPLGVFLLRIGLGTLLISVSILIYYVIKKRR